MRIMSSVHELERIATMSDPLRSFDINLLVAFDALMLTRSVTRSAEQLHVSQSAVSHMLSRLRHSLADPLLVKHGNRMLATARAEELHAGVREGLALVRTGLKRAEPFHPRTSTREFVLYAPEYFETILLPRLLDRMRSLAPEHSIQGRLRQQVVPSMVHRCMSYISAVGVLQSTNHMMVLPLQVAEFSAKGFDLRVVA